ncbi:MAG: hypothetical protein QM687_09535 [Ferruginibacter sp.]
MKKIVIPFLALALPSMVFAQKPADRKLIDNLCGCFDVDFKYAETFAPDIDYKFHAKEEIPPVAELALPIEQSDKKVVIQHLLVVNDTMVVKHWREEWTYENPVVWTYNSDRSWTKKTLKPEEVKGKWTQTVWETSDEPRYQGLSQFVHMDGKIIWQNTTDAPLPRREYSTRSDYNILKRTNRINVTDSGYLHEQDNVKIIRTNGKDQVLVQEKGLNNYKRIASTECDAAVKYWEKNHVYWDKVRKAWDSYIASSNVIKLEFKVDGKMLHEYLFKLGREYATKKVTDAEVDQRIKAEIDKFIIKNDQASK